VSLTVCSITNAPLDQIAATIAPFRPFADEVIIAVDARVDPELAAAHRAFADCVVRVPFAPPVERSLAWLHSHCSSDWIMRIDSDEIASPALAALLPELTRSGDLTHYWIPRRWLYPDRTTYLRGWPWLPDYQLRLVRNDPALLRFPGTVHTSVSCLGPGRYLRDPIYHLDCVIRSKEERVAKVHTYNRLGGSAQTAPGAEAISEEYYLPERRRSLPMAAVPSVDLAALAADAGKRFLARLSPSGRQSSRVATREEVDRLWSRRTLADDAYSALLSVADRHVSIRPGETRTLDVDVTNRSSETWEWGADATPPIHLSYRVRRNGTQDVGDGPRTPMPATVSPGSTIRVPLVLQAPDMPGEYVLTVDLVHEHVRWFGTAVDLIVEVNCGVPRRSF
jgi:hypothetical protein